MRAVRLYFIYLFFIAVAFCCAQNRTVDSLNLLINTGTADTTIISRLILVAKEWQNKNKDTAIDIIIKAIDGSNQLILKAKEGSFLKMRIKMELGASLHLLARLYQFSGKYDLALESYLKAIEIWDELLIINYQKKDVVEIKKRWASSTGNIGNVYKAQGDYETATRYFFKALAVDSSISNKSGMARHYGNLGLVNSNTSNYSDALIYYFKALSIAEKLGEKDRMAVQFGNIGIVYEYLKKYDKALQYHQKAIEIDKELNNQIGVSTHLGNIGIVFEAQKNYAKALAAYKEALKINEELGDKEGITSVVSNIGGIFLETKNYAKAIECYERALKIDEEIGNKRGKCIRKGNIGGVYFSLKKYKMAVPYLVDAISLAEDAGLLNMNMQFNEVLSAAYDSLGNNEKSFKCFKTYYTLKDSIFNMQKNSEFDKYELKHEFETKEAFARSNQEKKNAVEKAEQKKQKLILTLVFMGLIFVFIFVVFIFRSLRITKKQKKFIEIKNKETEEQKNMIQEKNKEILDSIHYALRIQQALLPSEKYLDKHIK